MNQQSSPGDPPGPFDQNADLPEEAATPDDGFEDPLGFGGARMGEGDAAELSVESLREQLAAAEAQSAERWEMLLRMQADGENLKKRSAKEVSDAKKFALERFVNELLPVKDSLEMGVLAASAEDASVEKIREGSELTLKMLQQVLQKFNVVEIDPSGEKFDPNLHQAMSMQPVEGVASNTVTEVMQKGYTLNDRLVRPALVMVAK